MRNPVLKDPMDVLGLCVLLICFVQRSLFSIPNDLSWFYSIMT